MSRFAYLPHTQSDIDEMLSTIGAQSIDSLFEDIPDKLRLKQPLDIPKGISEYEIFCTMKEIAARNNDGVCFLGGGIYDHIIPATVTHITSRSEFATAYTPYQAEISQGILQSIFEFQTMVCMLTGLDVPNASLYDGHTAAIEACAMAVNARRRANKILYSATIHPHTKQVIETYFEDLDVETAEIPSEDGATDWSKAYELIDENTAGVLVQTPNIFGITEDFSGVADQVHENKASLIISSNPISLGLLKNPGGWGADIAIGDGQPCGLPMNAGGPSVGYIVATERLMRKMPGRIVGRTVDAEDQRAFVLTLQAREQHIKRERATSNICTNQALAALAMGVYLATVGPQGLKEVAEQCFSKAHYLASDVTKKTGARMRYDKPFFNEFVLSLGTDAEAVATEMRESGIYAGIPLSRLGTGDSDELLVAVTEKRTKAEMDAYVSALEEAIR